MKHWSRTEIFAFLGFIVTALGLLFGPGLWNRIAASTGQPEFQYVFEGAFDQARPEYEVAFPLSWNDSQPSKARILVRADYSGKQYPGIAYLKIRTADGAMVDTGQSWADFSTQSRSQLTIPLTFGQLFDYAGLENYVINPDISAQDPELASGAFMVLVEQAGKIIPGSEQTITVHNTPWFHRTYLDNYEVAPGELISAYVEVVNFGAESDFSVATCPYRIVTPSYQVDPAQVEQLENEGWWPTRPGNLDSVCDNEQQTPIHLKRGEKATVKIELPPGATEEQGYYDLIVYVMKRLTALDYGGQDWFSNWYARNGRQHTTYVVIGR
jgi:hypothetical protein